MRRRLCGFARAARAAAEMVMAVMVSEAKAEKANEVAATAMAVRGAAEGFFSRKEADEPMMARTATEVTTAFATVKAVEALPAIDCPHALRCRKGLKELAHMAVNRIK